MNVLLRFTSQSKTVGYYARGRLAQLARAPARHAGGHWFKSSTAQLCEDWEVLLLDGFRNEAASAASFFPGTQIWKDIGLA